MTSCSRDLRPTAVFSCPAFIRRSPRPILRIGVICPTQNLRLRSCVCLQPILRKIRSRPCLRACTARMSTTTAAPVRTFPRSRRRGPLTAARFAFWNFPMARRLPSKTWRCSTLERSLNTSSKSATRNSIFWGPHRGIPGRLPNTPCAGAKACASSCSLLRDA